MKKERKVYWAIINEKGIIDVAFNKRAEARSQIFLGERIIEVHLVRLRPPTKRNN